MTSEEKSEHGGHGQGPGVHGSDEEKKRNNEKDAAIADGDGSEVD